MHVKALGILPTGVLTIPFRIFSSMSDTLRFHLLHISTRAIVFENILAPSADDLELIFLVMTYFLSIHSDSLLQLLGHITLFDPCHDPCELSRSSLASEGFDIAFVYIWHNMDLIIWEF